MNNPESLNSEFAAGTFSAPRERVQAFTATILRDADQTRIRRVLDIGCGQGEQILDLAQALPEATLTGMDLSERNIRAAQLAAQQAGLAGRTRFLTADYLRHAEPPFDLIVSFSALHLIVAPTEQVLAKVSQDLAPGGLLVFSSPYRCLYNTALIAFRRLLRLCRGRFTDWVVFRLGRCLHGGDVDEALLRDRVIYMYIVPEFSIDSRLHRCLKERFGMDLVRMEKIRHESLAQPKHAVCVYRKRP